jgi:outer membrane protein assembly factor BamB
VLDFNTAGSTPFLVMDYATGGTMRERYPKGTIVPLTTIISSIQQVADALQYAHDEKLIHRDIKPENILLDQRHNVLLSDFGIALVAQSSRYQNTQEVIGTASYMSPEQIQGKPRPASDQYSLGVVVYEWLCGTRPFEGSLTELWSQHMFAPPPPLRGKIPTISREVEDVVMTALQKDPKQRFGSVRAFATALQQASQVGQERTITSEYLPIDTTPPASPQPIMPPLTRPSIAIRPQRGGQKWSFPTHGRVISSPTVVNGTVYFGSDDGNLYALDAASGQHVWLFPTSSAVQSSPTVQNDILYFGSHDDNFYALDAASGQRMWSFQTGGKVQSSPTVTRGVVYFGSHDDNFYALDAASGQRMWSFQTGGKVQSSPRVIKGIVYFSSWDGSLYALDAASGQHVWLFPTSSAVQSSPTVQSGMVFVGSDDSNLYALDAFSGQEKWSFQTGGKVQSSPTMINGVVYVGSDDGNLYALDAFSGQEMWSFQTGGKVQSSPTMINGVVYVGSNDGNLYAVFA